MKFDRIQHLIECWNIDESVDDLTSIDNGFHFSPSQKKFYKQTNDGAQEAGLHEIPASNFNAASSLLNDHAYSHDFSKHPLRDPGFYLHKTDDGHELVAHGWSGKPMAALRVDNDRNVTGMDVNPETESDAIDAEWLTPEDYRYDAMQSLMHHVNTQHGGYNSINFLPKEHLADSVHQIANVHANEENKERHPENVQAYPLPKENYDIWKPQYNGELEEVDNFQKLKNNKDFKAKSGIDLNNPQTKFLGRGSYGFAMGDGKRAVKITSDPREAVTSSYLKRNPVNATWKIDGVYYHPQINKHIITGEQLHKDPDRAAKIFDELSAHAPSNSMRFSKYTLERLKPLLSPDAYKLAEHLHELYNHNIDFVDFHDGNIMFTPEGEPKLIDMGVSKSPLHNDENPQRYIDNLQEKRLNQIGSPAQMHSQDYRNLIWNNEENASEPPDLSSYPEKPAGIHASLTPNGSEYVAHSWDRKPIGIMKLDKNRNVVDAHVADGAPADAVVKSLFHHAATNGGINDVGFIPRNIEIGDPLHYSANAHASQNNLPQSDENKDWYGHNRTDYKGDFRDIDVFNKLKSHPKLAQKIGLDFNEFEPEYLGRGANGFVVGHRDNALKVTSQQDDAETSSYLKRNPIEGVNRVHGVYYHPKTKSYLIKSEKLNKDSDKADYIFGQFLRLNNVDALTTDYWTDERLRQMRKKLSPEAYKVAQAMNRLRKHNIHWEDLHTGNIMFNGNGDPTLIDLGRSSSPYTPEIERI